MSRRFGWNVGDILELEDEQKEFYGTERSGNYGHAGIPGHRGGSAPGGGGGGEVKPLTQEEENYLQEAEKNPEVQKARAEMGSQEKPTAELYKVGGFYTQERKRIHYDVVRELLNPKAVAKPGEERRAIFIIGPPGSGKSEVIFKKMEGEYTHIDADEIKKRLPEYNGKNASRLHEESGDVAEKLLLPKAIRDGHHIVVDQVGKNFDKIERQIAACKRMGYKIELHYVRVSPIEAAKRAMTRYRERGRWVDPDYIIRKVDSKPEATFQKVKKLADKYRKYDNEVPKGQEAKLVEAKD